MQKVSNMQITKSLPTRLLICGMCIAAAQLAVWRVQQQSKLLAAPGEAFDVTDLPLQIGQWSSTLVDIG